VLAGYARRNGGPLRACGEGGGPAGPLAALEQCPQAGLACCKELGEGRSDAPGDCPGSLAGRAGRVASGGQQALIIQISKTLKFHCQPLNSRSRSEEAQVKVSVVLFFALRPWNSC